VWYIFVLAGLAPTRRSRVTSNVRPLKEPMPRIYLPSLGTADWRRLLADPEMHWKRGRSALELAVSWESARNTLRGLPPEVAATLDSVDSLRGSELLLGVPEHQVHLEGGGHPSQNDLWALLRTAGGLASLALEAKAGEPLDKIVSDWLPDPGQKSRKPQRLAALQSLLGIKSLEVGSIRYQLLHRAASALLEAQRFHTQTAVLLVQSFDRTADEQSWQDFRSFARLLGTEVVEGALAVGRTRTAVPLLIGWVNSRPASDAAFAAAV
jgi:hypothetical protein